MDEGRKKAELSSVNTSCQKDSLSGFDGLSSVNDKCDNNLYPVDLSVYSFLFKFAEELFYVLDETGTVIYVNNSFIKTFGYSEEEIVGRNIISLFPPDRRQDAEVMMQEILKGQRNLCSVPLLTKSGMIIPVERRVIQTENSGRTVFLVINRDISKVAESRYRLLFEKSMDAVAILAGSPPKFFLVNPAFEDLVGYSSSEILSFSSDDMWKIVHPEDIPLVMARLAARFNGEAVPPCYEYRVVRKDGTTRWIEVSANILNTDNEDFALNIYRDISARKKAEELLKEAEARYRLLFENSIDALAIFGGLPPTFRQVNASFIELFGYSSEEILGFDPDEMWSLVYEEDRELVKSRLYTRIEGGAPPSHYEFRIITQKKETRWVDVSTNTFDVRDNLFSQAIFRDITERKNAEKALQDRESRLSAIFETTTAGILVVDTKGKVKTINKRMSELFACSPDELYGHSYTDLVHHDNLDKGEQGLKDLLAGSVEKINTERHYSRMDGTDFWGVVNACRLLGPDGELEGLLGVISDITGKKISEDLLVEREAFLNAVIENLPFDMWAVDRDSRYILQNETSRKCWGSMIGKKQSDFSELAGQETLDLWLSNNKRAFSGERISEEASYCLRGKKHHFINALNPVWKKGSVIGVIGINIDITDRKTADELIKSRLMIAEYADTHPVVDILTKAVDEIERLTESSIGFCHFVSEIDRTILLQAWSTRTLEVMCSAAPGQVHYNIEEAGVWTDCILYRRPVIHNNYDELTRKKGLPAGHAKIIRELVVPLFSGDSIVAVIGVGNKAFDYDERDIGIVSDLLGMIWDVVMRKRAEEERIELEKRLLHTQKLESLGVMAGGIAHDFNNLLMAIIGNLELALMELPEQSSVTKSIDQAMIASKRAADLTRQMLAYSGKGHFLISSVSISDLVKENAGIFKTVIPKSIELKLELMNHLPRISADSGQIQQIVMNLITNAAESFGEKTGVIKVKTYVEKMDEEYINKSRIDVIAGPGLFVCLEVADTGCGMDKETLNRIFDPFFTTKFTGRGLGMSAVLGIVKGHLGAVVIDSREGEGTTIKIFFPVSEKTFGIYPDFVELPLPGATGVNHATLLVVDDEDMILKVCKNALQGKGFSVMTASDGEEAVAFFKEHSGKIDCVVLDLKMPRLDGISAFRELRKIRPDVRVILTSGYSEAEAGGLFVDEGLNGFIQKPYHIRELIAEINRCIN